MRWKVFWKFKLKVADLTNDKTLFISFQCNWWYWKTNIPTYKSLHSSLFKNIPNKWSHCRFSIRPSDANYLAFAKQKSYIEFTDNQCFWTNKMWYELISNHLNSRTDNHQIILIFYRVLFIAKQIPKFLFIIIYWNVCSHCMEKFASFLPTYPHSINKYSLAFQIFYYHTIPFTAIYPRSVHTPQTMVTTIYIATIRFSCTPHLSKWWWSGAILNILLCVFL